MGLITFRFKRLRKITRADYLNKYDGVNRKINICEFEAGFHDIYNVLDEPIYKNVPSRPGDGINLVEWYFEFGDVPGYIRNKYSINSPPTPVSVFLQTTWIVNTNKNDIKRILKQVNGNRVKDNVWG